MVWGGLRWPGPYGQVCGLSSEGLGEPGGRARACPRAPGLTARTVFCLLPTSCPSLRDLPVPDFIWTVWLTWKTWFKDEEKND